MLESSFHTVQNGKIPYEKIKGNLYQTRNSQLYDKNGTYRAKKTLFIQDLMTTVKSLERNCLLRLH